MVFPMWKIQDNGSLAPSGVDRWSEGGAQLKPWEPVRIESGMSLVELMVSVGILSIVTYGVMTMLTAQGQEVRALQESLAKLDLEPTIIKSFSNGGICSYMLSDPSQASTATPPNRSQDTIDATSASTLAGTVISVQKIPSAASVSAGSFAQVGQLASANSGTVKIAYMKFKNFRLNGVDQYLADFEVGFKPPPATVRQMSPIVIKDIGITSDASDPINAKSLLDCSSPRGPAPGLHRFTFTTTTPGTTRVVNWVVPAGVTDAFVTMAGGGGSGVGWRVSNVVKAGASGGYVITYPVHLVAGETVTITVGKGGESYAPVASTTSASVSPYKVYAAPSGDNGLGGYPGDASKIVSPSLGTIIECAGGSGAYTGGIDGYGGYGGTTVMPVPGNVTTSLDGASYGSGVPSYSAPNRPATGSYAHPDGPGSCGPGPTGLGIGNPGQIFWGANAQLNSGTWTGGRTPMGYGSGGDIGVSGCYVTTTTPGTCVFPKDGRDGVVFIDVLY